MPDDPIITTTGTTTTGKLRHRARSIAAATAQLTTPSPPTARGRRLRGDTGQATTEYALVLLAAALIGLLAVAWATAGGGAGRIGELFDRVLDSIIERVWSGRRDDHGQATVELALCLPVVVLVALAIVQVATVIRDQLAVELAAREGARAAAVSAAPSEAASVAAVRAASSLAVDTATVVAAETVTVTVSASSTTDIALIGPLLADVRVSATVTMALEPP